MAGTRIVHLSKRLMCIFVVLFLLAGISTLFLDKYNPNPATEYALAGMLWLFLGGFALCLAWNALAKGEINLQHVKYNRRSQPHSFTVMVVFILIAGCGTLLASVWFWFFK